MEMNVSNTDEQVVARKKGGLNPAVIIPILFAIGIAIFLFVLGNPSNFQEDARIAGTPSVAFADIKGTELHPHGLGVIYMGGVLVPVLITFMIIVIVFAIERAIVLNKAAGSGNVDNFVLTIRSLLNKNKVDEALEAHDTTLDKEQKMAGLNKAIEEATTLEMPMLEKNMNILSTLGTVATLVALSGTVLGMIRSFQALGEAGGTPDAAALSIGISEALMNTALGIGTSAIAIILYNYFTSKIDGLTYKIDEISMSIQQSFAEFH